MALRSILIFPHFENIQIIHQIRSLYDPLSHKIAPHITLVFPFDSPMTDERLAFLLETHLNHIPPFQLTLQGITPHSDTFGHYLFLNVQKGASSLIKIHQHLYKEELEHFHLDSPYLPHMTLGKFDSRAQLETAYNTLKKITTSFTTTIDTISVEVIGPDEQSIIIYEKKLCCN